MSDLSKENSSEDDITLYSKSIAWAHVRPLMQLRRTCVHVREQSQRKTPKKSQAVRELGISPSYWSWASIMQ